MIPALLIYFVKPILTKNANLLAIACSLKSSFKKDPFKKAEFSILSSVQQKHFFKKNSPIFLKLFFGAFF